ncbi:hypothetical protein [Thermomicrobium roseum]|jgi:hypothetical protein|uniref:Uncharacterized protein n=1 Tax=Thermomicrobium roseum (strain ATCC 27502 / DSM 5159 / P-2) TaxID=309801 RepID=B9L247_THERP|nr:hypothetical protein [Thermomicrobium roseum]ACM05955.1 hypothetical protein trd_1947 [Thermomicrobium roseum DSM 5159]
MTAEPVKLHLDTQYATGLLVPIAEVLRELEARLRHYQLELRLAEIDLQCIVSAHQAVAEASRVVEDLVQRGVQAQTWREGGY